jgi:signal transduction histidine kinase
MLRYRSRSATVAVAERLHAAEAPVLQCGGVERGVLVGVAGLRWAAWLWLTVVALLNLHRVHHPAIALAAVVVTGVVTVLATMALRTPGWERAMRPAFVGVEVAVAAAVVTAEAWVRQAPVSGQSLAGTWPLAAILVAAVAGGLVWGVGVGTLLAGARLVALTLGGSAVGQGGRAALAAVSTGVSWIVIGAVCGTIIRLLRRAQHQLAEAEARDAIAHDLHDGVLQTLALIERRSESTDIARLARDQERDLRAYLFGGRPENAGLPAELRAAAGRLERTWPSTAVTVTVSIDAPKLEPAKVDAVVGAATEALTNAAKHGQAHNVVVFADIDESSGGLFLSVKDDGGGFDPAAVVEGMGMARSIRGRIEQVGGRVEFASSRGDGAEVRIAVPPSSRRAARRG